MKKTLAILACCLAAAIVTSQTQWKPCRVTTYGKRPSGKPYHGSRTASGTRYNEWAMTCAVPPSRKGGSKPMVPYGSILEVRWKGKTVRVTATDLCPGMTVDLSTAAMKALLGRYENTTLRGAQWRVVR